MIDYDGFDATGLAELVATGAATPHDLLDLALERAEAWQPHINALVHIDEERARAMIDDGLPDGPLKGVPFLLKDLGCETPDFPISSGSRIAPPVRFPRHSAVYERLRAAGLVPFARTTTPESGIGPVTEAAAYGAPTRNPFDLDRTPGGSSGGSAAAVAARIVTAAHGSDGGGSIRMPAACCGLVGLKPTRARIPDGPYAGEGWGGMAIEGVLTRSVRDTALLLDILSGPDLGAPYVAPPLKASFRAALNARPGPLRVAICRTRFDGSAIEPDCADAVAKAADALEALGHHVEEICPDLPIEEMMVAWTRIVACGTENWVRAVAEVHGREVREKLEPVAAGACALAAQIDGAAYLEAVNTIHAFGRSAEAFFANGPDVLVTATLAEPPARIGRFAHSRPEFADFMDYRLGPNGVFGYSPFVVAFNASGQPAISLPLHQTDAGLPIGVHIAAPFGQDERLITLAAQLEETMPWRDRRPAPPVS